MTRSTTVGIPNFLVFPLSFGISTRSAGIGLYFLFLFWLRISSLFFFRCLAKSSLVLLVCWLIRSSTFCIPIFLVFSFSFGFSTRSAGIGLYFLFLIWLRISSLFFLR